MYVTEFTLRIVNNQIRTYPEITRFNICTDTVLIFFKQGYNLQKLF